MQFSGQKNFFLIRECIQMILLVGYVFSFLGEFTVENGLFLIADDIFNISFPSELKLFYGTLAISLIGLVFSRLLFPKNNIVLILICLFFTTSSVSQFHIGISQLFTWIVFVIQNCILSSYLFLFIKEKITKNSSYSRPAQVA